MKKCQFCDKDIKNWRKFCSKKCSAQNKSKNSNRISEEYLLLEYVNNRKEVLQMSKEKGCSVHTIFRYLKKYNIPTRGCFIDYSNTRIGNLLITTQVGVVKRKSGEHVRWNCECDCGSKFTRLSSSLSNSSHHQKCIDCYRKTRRSKEEITQFIFGIIKRGGTSRNLEFSITKKYIYELFLKQNRKCALSGIDIMFAETGRLHQKGYTTASLDRIDSSKGYVEGNVQWVHKDINQMKMAMNQDKFIEYCHFISKNMSKT